MLLNQPRAIALMKKNGMDALIATHPNHVTYASNYERGSRRDGDQTHPPGGERGRADADL